MSHWAASLQQEPQSVIAVVAKKSGSAWNGLIAAASPLMLRGGAGTMIFVEAFRLVPDLPNTIADSVLQWGATGGAGVSAVALVWGLITGK